VALTPVPERVRIARERAAAAGFDLSCEDEVGRLLRVLAAAVRPGGRILELGTGTGVGLAWLVSGVEGRDDVAITSVELDPALAAVAAALDWPAFVDLRCADALAVLDGVGDVDLLFADAQGGKTEGLERSILALGPGGLLAVDDMRRRPADGVHASLWPQLQEVRATLLGDDRLAAVEVDWASGLILAARVA
jgi:demethylmenaquinone methyltransferase/2-methoxy-6-polyprenyl-1,4-benzoquinol methylase